MIGVDPGGCAAAALQRSGDLQCQGGFAATGGPKNFHDFSPGEPANS